MQRDKLSLQIGSHCRTRIFKMITNMSETEREECLNAIDEYHTHYMKMHKHYTKTRTIQSHTFKEYNSGNLKNICIRCFNPKELHLLNYSYTRKTK